ncbi:hypothetical protein P0Y43_19880 [Pseudomonas entomophila]|uniref:hypothetical protein n=1 Tax=Pseudomonas entomophila TaxID=312306 RepID=UPI0023D81D76|nr:hypothetical protein [Pseudomonas entomophila]MDF0732956.1 hypothetical protein [Pseudomonas entomophila]
MIETSLAHLNRLVTLATLSRSHPAPPPQPVSSPANGEEVVLSAEGLALSAEATLSKKQLEEKFQRIYGPDNLLLRLHAEVARLGRNAPALSEEPAGASPERLKQSRQAAKYIEGVVKAQRQTDNPFAHLSRQEVVAILEDESGAYTSVERYAASEAVRELDNARIGRFWARLSLDNDHRAHVVRTLEFFDSLGELERMRYPAGTRDFYVTLLNQPQPGDADYQPLKMPSLVEILKQIDDAQRNGAGDEQGAGVPPGT